MLKFAPPGTKRVRGVQRAQCKTIQRLAKSQLKFNTKEAARNPPIVYLNPLNLASMQAIVTTCQALLDIKN